MHQIAFPLLTLYFFRNSVQLTKLKSWIAKSLDKSHMLLSSISFILTFLVCCIEVMDIPHSLFEEKLEKLKNSKGVKLDTDLTANDLKDLVKQYKNVYLEAKGEKFPSGAACYTINFFTFCCYTFILS